MNVEEEVILWVTSDLCSSSTAASVDDNVPTSAIPVALISRTDDNGVQNHLDPLQFEVKEEFCIMEEDSAAPNDKKSRRRGVVWNYFIPTVPDRAQCTLCSTAISYKGKSTNNLLRHLRTKHAEITKIPPAETKFESCTTEDGSTYYVLSAPAEPPASPARSASSFHDDAESSSPVRKRGGVWKFFRTDSKKRAKCKLCSTLISFKGGSTTNLLRHMKSKHAGVKVPHKLVTLNNNSKNITMQTRSSIQHSFAEIVNECVKSDDEAEYDTLEQLNFGSSGGEMDDVENITTLSSLDPNLSEDVESSKEMTETFRERKKSAVAWKFFDMESDERAKCTICEVCISFKGGSTGNLLRHLKTKHSEVDVTPPVKKIEIEYDDMNDEVGLEAIENEELAKFVQLLNPKYKLQGIPVPRLNEKEVPKRMRKRGAALSFFNISSEDVGTCQLCAVTINLRNGSKGALLRHLMAKHPEIDTMLVTSNSESGVNVENIENIPIDINEKECFPKNKVTKKIRKRGLVWNHFAPLEDEKAKCISCPAVISYKHGSTSNLLRHMKKKHPEIDVRDEVNLKAELTDQSSSEEDSDDLSSPLTDGKPLRILRKRGKVWNHFKPVAQDKAKCGVCNAVVVYLKGSTTNLLRHMKKRHPSIDLSKEKPFNKRLTLPSNDSKCTANGSSKDRETSMDWSTNSPLTTGDTGEKMNAIYRRSEIIFRKHFDKFLNRPVSVTKTKLYDEQLATMIVKQYCPFTIVESEEFRKFVQTVNPGYSLPSRKTISSRLIPELYEKCVEKVREHLRHIRYVTVGTNGWTLPNNECYMSITAHFIDDECTFQSYLLGCFRYEEHHSAENLFGEIKAILIEWDLINKVVAVVSDNAANINAAIRLRSWRHMPCFAGMLNSVVQTGLLEIQATYEKVKIIVDHFKKNPLAAKKLATLLKEMNLREARLKPDDPNRWNTTYDMFSQMLDCKEALVNLDSYIETLPMLNEHEWLLLEKTCTTLKPLLDITDEVSEKNITVSKVIPLSRCIGNYLKKMVAADHLPPELHLMLNKMTDEIALQFNDVEDNSLLAESAFLDPRFKNQAFVNEQSYSNTYHSILQRASGVQLGDERTTSNDSSANNIWEDFDTRVNQLNNAQNSEMAAAAEIENYLQETLLSRSSDPLVWWKERKSLYPRLFDLMKQRLCIAATAVPKHFSDGGQLVCEKRNKLSSTKVSMVLFLNHNL